MQRSSSISENVRPESPGSVVRPLKMKQNKKPTNRPENRIFKATKISEETTDVCLNDC